MTHRNRLRAGAVPALAAVALLSACSTSVVGTAAPAGSPSPQPVDESTAAGAGPLDELLGGLALHEELGERLAVADLAAHPDGGAVLLARAGSSDDPDYVIRLLPSAEGVELGDVREVPSQPTDADVNVAPDGTIVVTSSGEDRTERPEFRLFVLAPGATEPEERVVTGLGEDEAPVAYEAVLSADGQTLYVGLAWSIGPETPAHRVVAIDVATGEVTASQELPYDAHETAVTFKGLALRADGGLTALALYVPELGHEPPPQMSLLIEFDADLGIVGQPIELTGDGERGFPRGLGLTTDGAAVVTLEAEVDGSEVVRVLVVRDGEVTDRFDLEETADAPSTVGLAPDDRHVYLPYGDESGQWVLGTVDLTTGAVVSAVPLCPAADPHIHRALAQADVDGQTMIVAAPCVEGGFAEAFRVG